MTISFSTPHKPVAGVRGGGGRKVGPEVAALRSLAVDSAITFTDETVSYRVLTARVSTYVQSASRKGGKFACAKVGDHAIQVTRTVAALAKVA